MALRSEGRAVLDTVFHHVKNPCSMQNRALHRSELAGSDRPWKLRPNSGKAMTDCIRLTGLPRSAKPSDIVRLAKQIVKTDGGLENIAEVTMDYHRFAPTGRAIIRMSDDKFLGSAVRTLRTANLSTIPLLSFKTRVSFTTRTRGAKGRAEAAERAVIDGNGPGGGIYPKGSDVVLSGLPEQVSASSLRSYLKRMGYVEVGTDGWPNCEVLKVESSRRWQTATSKHLIRVKTPGQAHALVRRLHMTYYIPEDLGTEYLIKARVVY